MFKALRCRFSRKQKQLLQEEEMVESGTQENPIVVEENNAMSLLICSTTIVVLETELLLVNEQVNKYRKFISTRMLALDDATLTEMANFEKFSEAFIKGWNVWKKEQKKCFKPFVLSCPYQKTNTFLFELKFI